MKRESGMVLQDSYRLQSIQNSQERNGEVLFNMRQDLVQQNPVTRDLA